MSSTQCTPNNSSTGKRRSISTPASSTRSKKVETPATTQNSKTSTLTRQQVTPAPSDTESYATDSNRGSLLPTPITNIPSTGISKCPHSLPRIKSTQRTALKGNISTYNETPESGTTSSSSGSGLQATKLPRIKGVASTTDSVLTTWSVPPPVSSETRGTTSNKKGVAPGGIWPHWHLLAGAKNATMPGSSSSLVIKGAGSKPTPTNYGGGPKKTPVKLASLTGLLVTAAATTPLERPLTITFKVVLLPKVMLDMVTKIGGVVGKALPVTLAAGGSLYATGINQTELRYKMSQYFKRGTGLRILQKEDKEGNAAWKTTFAARATISHDLEMFKDEVTDNGSWTMKGDVSLAEKNWEQTYFCGSKKFFPPLPIRGKQANREKILKTDDVGTMLWAPNRQPTLNDFRCPHCNGLNRLPSNPKFYYHCGGCSQLFDTREPQGVEDLTPTPAPVTKKKKKKDVTTKNEEVASRPTGSKLKKASTLSKKK